MSTPIFHDCVQCTDEWHAARCGVITSSRISLLLTPTGKIADNDTSRAHVYELAAQRVTRYTEPTYTSDDMMRGLEDEPRAIALYSEKYAPVTRVGFVTREVAPGVIIGCSPDGMVGDNGQIECKSRRQKYQFRCAVEGGVPSEYMLQIQTALLVTSREWLDFVSYSGGMPMIVRRVLPDQTWHERIIEAAAATEGRIAHVIEAYHAAVADFHPTKREEQEIVIT